MVRPLHLRDQRSRVGATVGSTDRVTTSDAIDTNPRSAAGSTVATGMAVARSHHGSHEGGRAPDQVAVYTR